MTDEEKKAIGKIDISKTIESNINYWRNKCLEQQKELEKKDKVINEMANNIADNSNVYENLVNTEFQHTAEEVIEYFTKQVEGE